VNPEAAGSRPNPRDQAFPRRIDSLDEVFRFVSDALADLGVDSQHEFTVHLVVEEVFTNMVKYNPASLREITLGIDREGSLLRVRLVDPDADSFDLTQAPEVDVNQPLADRTPGGLGIHLVRRMTESLSYRYESRTSTIEMGIRLDQNPPGTE